MTFDDDRICHGGAADQTVGKGPARSGTPDRGSAPTSQNACTAASDPRSDVNHAGSVAVVVDGSVAALGAARWAAAVAQHTGRDLVAVVLLPADPGSRDEGRAVLGRVEPTLRSAGTVLTVLACRTPAARSLRQQAVLTAAEVLRCLTPVEVELLVLPGDGHLVDPRRHRYSLAAQLAADRSHDLLIVPGLERSPARRPAPVGR